MLSLRIHSPVVKQIMHTAPNSGTLSSSQLTSRSSSISSSIQSDCDTATNSGTLSASQQTIVDEHANQSPLVLYEQTENESELFLVGVLIKISAVL